MTEELAIQRLKPSCIKRTGKQGALPSKGRPIPSFGCSQYGKCIIRADFAIEGVACCETCLDRVEPTLDKTVEESVQDEKKPCGSCGKKKVPIPLLCAYGGEPTGELRECEACPKGADGKSKTKEKVFACTKHETTTHTECLRFQGTGKQCPDFVDKSKGKVIIEKQELDIFMGLEALKRNCEKLAEEKDRATLQYMEQRNKILEEFLRRFPDLRGD